MNSSFFMAAYYSIVYMCQFSLSSLYHWWAFGLALSLCYWEQCHNKHMCACVIIIECCIILWLYTSNGIAGTNGISSFRFLRNCCAVFHNSWANLYFHHQCKSVPISPHPLQHVLSPDFLMIAILTGVRWYLIVVSICISLITSADELFFHMFVGRINVFFWEVSVHIICPLFDVFFFFLVNLFMLFVDSGYLPFVRWVDCKIFLPFYSCLLTMMMVSFVVQNS